MTCYLSGKLSIISKELSLKIIPENIHDKLEQLGIIRFEWSIITVIMIFCSRTMYTI